ncbi:MAG: MarR family transcriptional regulator [Gemmatimonadales bacterium]|nr:MarR family transcriptional regulator [Gemmatimonadales bacterium]
MTQRPSPLQRELKQRRAFASRAQEAAIGLLRTADVVRRRIAVVIEPSGLSLPQYNVLRILRGAGPAGLATLEVADRLIERAPGITRLCDGLERRGLLERTRSREDRRVVECRITPAGAALLAGLDEPVAEADAASIGRLSGAEIERLVELLDRVREEPAR